MPTTQSASQKDEVQNIIIATDAGREGELVARLILDKVHNKKPIKRLWISSVTKKAIVDGFKKLKDGRQFNQVCTRPKDNCASYFVVKALVAFMPTTQSASLLAKAAA